MPRDLVAYAEPAVETKPDLSKPTPAALIWILENWDQSPVSHLTFNFKWATARPNCGSAGCAYGTAEFLWGDKWTSACIGLGSCNSEEVFQVGQFDKRITAKVVAGRMRDALAGRRIRYLTAGDR